MYEGFDAFRLWSIDVVDISRPLWRLVAIPDALFRSARFTATRHRYLFIVDWVVLYM